MPTPSTETLWLDTLQRVSGRSAHELRGALNGVSVNLEVVRSRAEKVETTVPGGVAKYATAAGDQLGVVISMSEALLALARAPRGPTDVGATARRFEMLLAPAARADGRSLTVDPSADDLGATSASAAATRLVIGASVLAAVEASSRVLCRAEGNEDARLRVESCDDSPFTLGADVLAAAAEAGIDVQAERSAVSIGFPR